MGGSRQRGPEWLYPAERHPKPGTPRQKILAKSANVPDRHTDQVIAIRRDHFTRHELTGG